MVQETFTFTCGVCAKTEEWDCVEAARAAGEWHIWLVHRSKYLEVVGHAIDAPHPTTLGKRVQSRSGG